MADEKPDVVGDLALYAPSSIEDRMDAEALVAFIRAQSPEWQAALIGGDALWASGERGYSDCCEQWPDRSDAEHDAADIRKYGDEGVVFSRVLGPWVEVTE